MHGASHFLEHVLFKGTPSRYRRADLRPRSSRWAASSNAYTAKEHTCFYARVLHSDGALVVDVLSDMISNSLITGRDVDAERAVILDEIAMHRRRSGRARLRVGDRPDAFRFGSGRPVIGSPKSIAEMSRSQIVRHWRRHYRPPSWWSPPRAELDHDRLVDSSPAWTTGTGVQRRDTAAPTKIDFSGDMVSRQIRLEQSTAMLAFPGPGLFDERRYASGLLALILGGGMASTLFLEVTRATWAHVRHRRRGERVLRRRHLERRLAVRPLGCSRSSNWYGRVCSRSPSAG